MANARKLSFKYRSLGDNVVHLDAGIASAFFSAAISSMTGVVPSFAIEPSSCSLISEYLALRRDVFVPTWSMVISDAGNASVLAGQASAAYEDFSALVQQRRSIRDLRPADLMKDDIADLLKTSMPKDFGEPGGQVLAHLRLVVIVNESDSAEALLFSARDGGLSCTALDGVIDTGQLISQRLLAQAPVKIFFFCDLPELLRRHGADGHALALTVCGAWVGRLWMRAHRLDLSGCPAGAVAECEILSQLELAKAERWFNLFCFSLGRGPRLSV